MILKSQHTLIDPQTGNLAFKLYTIDGDNPFDHIQRLNYYTLIWVKQGQGLLKADFSEYAFGNDMLMSFTPYQPFMLKADDELAATVIHFHPDFFCIHKHHKDVACNGVLFNNIYAPPYVELDETTKNNLTDQIEHLRDEMQNAELAQYELLISHLKIFLIKASRLKSQQTTVELPTEVEPAPFVLQNLKESIEQHYRSKHSAGDYADMLAISAKSLATLTKKHFNKTLTDLISERIIIEAKRELYLTSKSIKEIAYDLGYQDEYYFSRFFKKNAEVSPQLYRETVGFDRGGK